MGFQILDFQYLNLCVKIIVINLICLYYLKLSKWALGDCLAIFRFEIKICGCFPILDEDLQIYSIEIILLIKRLLSWDL